MTKEYVRGYISVEASILMPFIIVVYLMLLYSVLYVYDRTLLAADTFMVCEKGRESFLMNKNPETAMKEEVRLIKAERPYAAASNLKISYSKKGNKITVNSKLDFKCPLEDFMNLSGLSKTITSERSIKVTKAHGVMRLGFAFTRE